MNDWQEMYNTRPTKIGDLLPDAADAVGIHCLTFFETWLEIIEIAANDAFTYFMIDYHDCFTMYTRESIVSVCEKVAAENAKKYDMMCEIYAAEFNPLENYDRTETSTHTRTPNLTKQTTTSATNGRTTTVDESQTKTTTTTPAEIETERKISPFDTNTYKSESKTIISPVSGDSGKETVTETWNGEPSTTTTSETGSGSGTETETGTETTSISSYIHGNIGVKSSQQMAEESMMLAAKMNIWNVIKCDIAAAVCVGVWP